MVGRWGDLNSDCDLTAMDVVVAQRVNVDGTFGAQCAWAQEQLDPTLDGISDEREAVFLQLVVANKLRFLAKATTAVDGVYEGSTGDLVVSVWLLNDRSEPAVAQTSVRLEIGYQGNANYSVGSSGGTVAGGMPPQYLEAFHLGLPNVPGEGGDHVDEQPTLDVMCCCANRARGRSGASQHRAAGRADCA